MYTGMVNTLVIVIQEHIQLYGYIDWFLQKWNFVRARFSYLLELFLVLNFFSGLQAWFFYFPAKD